MRIMEAIILIGIQASGKSTFCRQRLFDSHIRINMDMLRTRNRERLLLKACVEGRQAFVVDNTNPSRLEREPYIRAAKENGFSVVGYYFQSKASECLQRNAARTDKESIPEKGVLGTAKRLELPRYDEGFDKLYYVQIVGADEFSIVEWNDEI